MSYSKPAPTTYLQLSSESKTIDLVGLCRRLCAEFQYHDPFTDGNLVEIEKLESATSNQRVLKLIETKLETAPSPPNLPWKQPEKQEKIDFLGQLPVTRYAFRRLVGSRKLAQRGGVRLVGLEPQRVTAKGFKYLKTTPEGCPSAANLRGEKLRRIYWRQRLGKGTDVAIFVALGLVIEELKKQDYAGLLLPNGKVVPFEALRSFLVFRYVPKELSLFEYSLPAGFEASGNSSYPSEVNELNSAFFFGPQAELFCHHFVMALNLPEEDAQGKHGRLMIIDPTCAQFGMEGTNGELLYWGYSEDYVKSFPARDYHFKEDDLSYKPYNYRSVELYESPILQNMVKATLANLKLDSCGYCGDVPRKNENGETKLKTCSRCMKVYYCDVICQKMAWKGHKLECKKESE